MTNQRIRGLCGYCGEELIGAVNRCWRCGRTVPVRQMSGIPPVRRSPVSLRPSESVTAVAVPRRITRRFLNNPRIQSVGARAAILLGALGCVIGLVSAWSLIPAIAGMSLGILGMRSRRRDLAMTGLVVAVLALFMGFAQIGLDVWATYESRRLIDGLQEPPF